MRLSAKYPGPGIIPPADGTGFFLFLLQNNIEGSPLPGESAPGYSHLYVYCPGQRSAFGDHWYPDGMVKPVVSDIGNLGEWMAFPNQYPDFRAMPDFLAVLAADGRLIQSVTNLASTLGLTALAGPGGVILSMDYSHNQIVTIRPIDDAATSMVAYDIFSWRGRADGTVPFVIGGAGFGTLSGTTVTIGGVQASLTSVSATRIKGLIPANAAPSTQLLDVVVHSGGKQVTIPQAFRYN